jgi:hypothetical protein
MAAMPPSAGAGFSLGNVGSFLVNFGVSYLLGRLSAQDGQRLSNLAAAEGEYGVAMPRAYGGAVRLAGIFIAQADIKETRHTVQDYSELVGAATGAMQGFMIGGPVGALIGGVVGGLFGAATPNQHYYTYSDTFALLLADRTNDSPAQGLGKVWANGKPLLNPGETPPVSTFGSDGKLISQTFAKNRWYESLTFYTGHPEQLVDPVLTEVLEETGAYRPMAYIVVEDLQLAQFGQSVPPIECLMTAKAGETLASVAEAIAAAAGIDPTREMSTTRLAGKTVGGYAVTGESACWDALKPLMPVYAADAAETSGSIRFILRDQAMRATIPADDMGGHAYGDEAGTRISFSRATDIDLPKETSLTFLDPARDYQQNTATATRAEGNAKSNVSVSLPLTLTADEGASAAALMHWDAWLGRTSAQFSLTDKWISAEPGVAYAIPSPGGPVPFRLTRKLRGANGIIECEAVSDEQVTYRAVVAGASGTAPGDESTLFPDTRIVAIDMPILADQEDDFGFYVAMAGSAPYWTRGFVQATGNGTVWATILDSAASCPAMGDVTGVLAEGSTTGLDDTLDTTSVLTVVLLHDGMSLENATDAQLDGYANFAFAGKDGQGEYLQFKTATKVAPKTWELTNLRRGRKGTDWAIGAHVAGEEFALLGQGGVFRIVYADAAMWGTPLTLRGVTLHQDPEDADEVEFTNTGEGKRPYSPVNAMGTFDGSVNLAMTWDRRSRFNSGEIGTDAPESYEVDVWNDAGTAVVRTISSGTEAASYPATEQTADGLTPIGGQIVVDIYQLNPDRGRGHPRRAVFIGPNTAPLTLEDGTTAFHLENGTNILELEA